MCSLPTNQKRLCTNKEICTRELEVLAKTQKLPYCPIAFKSGQDALLYDYDGKEYIDLLSSASSANIGHGNKEIAKAVYNQMSKLPQFAIAYFSCREAVEYAEKLIELYPGDNNKKVIFSSSGSESIDATIKLSKCYTSRNKIISFNGAYHGSTFGALSISAISLNMKRKMGPMIPDIYHFNYPICIKCPYEKCESSCNLQCLKEIENAFSLYLPPEEVAAVFFEPIAGDAGIIVPPKRYVQALAELCKKYGILFVVDEIQQAWGRSGKFFAIENFDVEPDLIVMGKASGGGLPMGIVMGKTEIMDSLDAPAHVFTMSGNSTVCVAALKMLEIFERENLVEQSKTKGEYFKNKLLELKNKYDIIKDVRGLGLSIGVDLDNKISTTKIVYQCQQNGLVLISIGECTLRIQPPLVITYAQIDKSIDIIEQSINALLDGKISDEALSVINGW
ncbi:aminotransferase class III-fold pyridoxal phosphate-dependent enzyme [Intestinibacter bartlettii]|uniref:Aminotransferase class III-fold pyridoxal phosphate-dependent enzyme n=1 Tax=Intestinibacter bartlettii TaxID=261299 RepID=A0ABS6DTZ6_9FIRM|nr:aminotransferase class III-fold pyridoxal phosphate-dependent enzyme [Intestinibacter bartlettii]MBU5334908.1 aminotransferase class III-fold pyridoxal phosphate-dependent enzyme [Intestinibacter bartlettii]MDO5010528.1 aminotransferase class III-fold pyridoxal phosphate-dependent enzyme [Intestinibacter bartlettii]